jgi:glycosyltransferase involved in cell wall biosynthesis
MAAKNVQDYIAIAIESIINQTYSDWEMIIVNDGSTDQTASIVQKYSDANNRIKLISNKESVGQAIARNTAVEQSTGKYLAILDADDVAMPDRIEVQVDYLDKNPEIAAIGGHAEIIDAKGSTLGIKRKALNIDAIRFSLLLQNQFIHSTMMIRRDVFDTFGGYNNAFLYAEDYDLWSKILEKNIILNIDKIVSKFRIQPGSVTSMSATQKVQLRNNMVIVYRNVRNLVDYSDSQIQSMYDMVNNYLNILQTIPAFFLYFKLSRKYINRYNENIDVNRQLQIILINRLKYTLIKPIKKLLKK